MVRHEHGRAAPRHRHAEHDNGEKGEHQDRGAYIQSTHKSPRIERTPSRQAYKQYSALSLLVGLGYFSGAKSPRLPELSHWIASGVDTSPTRWGRRFALKPTSR